MHVPTNSSGEYPRPPQIALSRDALQPADVLLSRGSTQIADAIVRSDGASYSHAALWTGGSVVEAVLEGIFERGVLFTRDVYRYQDANGLSLPTHVAQAAVAFARAQVGLPYANGELLLLGALYTRGIRPQRPLLDAALELLGGATAGRLADWLESVRPRREPMICSELVARAFYEADASRAYALRVVPPLQRGTRTRGDSLFDGAPAWANAAGEPVPQQLGASCRRLLGARPVAYVAEQRDRKILSGAVAFLVDAETRLGHVTPGDIQFSPSLRYLGTIFADQS